MPTEKKETQVEFEESLVKSTLFTFDGLYFFNPDHIEEIRHKNIRNPHTGESEERLFVNWVSGRSGEYVGDDARHILDYVKRAAVVL